MSAATVAILGQVERTARGLSVDALATVILARIERTPDVPVTGSRTLQWTNAGHLPPVLLHPNGYSTLLDSPSDPTVSATSSSGACRAREPVRAGLGHPDARPGEPCCPAADTSACRGVRRGGLACARVTALSEAAQSPPDVPPAMPSQARRARDAAAAVARPLLLYVASRLLVVLAVFTGVRLPSAQTVPDPWPPVPSTGSATLDGLLRWDSAWYLHLVETGYASDAGDPRNAFFPLLPLLVRGVATLPGLGPVDAGLLVAAVTGAAATVAVWLLGRQLSGPAAADRMAALFAFFPGAMALSMVYAEGLLVTLAAGALLALHRRQWLLAGVLTALATASRPTALALVAACLWAALVAVAHPRDGSGREWRAFVAPALAPLGILAFFIHLASVTGEPLAWFSSQREGWRERVDLTAQLERVALVVADPAHPEGSLNTWLPVAGMAGMAVAFLALARWRPSGPVVVHALAASAMVLVSASIGARPRMVLGAFPLLMALAYVARGPVFAGLLGVCAGSTALLTVLTVASLAATP